VGGALDVWVAGAATAGDRLEPWAGQLLLIECVRSLVGAGRIDEARSHRDRLGAFADYSVAARAFLRWADGVLDPEAARRVLGEAAAAFDALGRRVEHGRCLLDLADAERRADVDPQPTSRRAKETLETAGASLFVREADDRLDRGGPAGA
jgi:hypothetical protein